jgi:hypothetical protein
MNRNSLLAALVTVAVLATTAHADRLSFELGAGAGGFSNAGDAAQGSVAMSLGVGIATSRRLAFDLRYVRLQDVGSTRTADRHFFLGPMVNRFVGERVFLGVGLGMAGANGVGPALDARVGAVLSTVSPGYLYASLEASAAIALDGDSDAARAALLLIGYRGR